MKRWKLKKDREDRGEREEEKDTTQMWMEYPFQFFFFAIFLFLFILVLAIFSRQNVFSIWCENPCEIDLSVEWCEKRNMWEKGMNDGRKKTEHEKRIQLSTRKKQWIWSKENREMKDQHEWVSEGERESERVRDITI